MRGLFHQDSNTIYIYFVYIRRVSLLDFLAWEYPYLSAIVAACSAFSDNPRIERLFKTFMSGLVRVHAIYCRA